MDNTSLVNSDQGTAHRYSLLNSKRSLIKCVIEQKKCVLCNEYFSSHEFSEHVAECIGPEDTPPNTPVPNESSPLKQPPDDDYSEHKTNDIELKSNRSDSSTSSIPEPIVHDKPLDDYANYDSKVKNDRSDSFTSSVHEPAVVHDKSLEDYVEDVVNNNDDNHAVNDIELKNNRSNSSTSSIPEPIVHDKPLDDYANYDSKVKSDRSDSFTSSIPEPVVYDKPLDDYVEDVVNNDDDNYAINDIKLENNPSNSSTSSSIPEPVVHDKPLDDYDRSEETPPDLSPLTQLPNNDYVEDDNSEVYATPGRMSPVIFDDIPTKMCILCQKSINQSEFVNHMKYCRSDISPRATIPKPKPSYSISDDDDDQDRIQEPIERVKECIVCFKLIKESEYVQHVHACLPDETTTVEIVHKPQKMTCFSCHRPINFEDNLSREISCPSRHIYCLTCIQYSMEKFVRTRSVPLCHLTMCDYELSRFDIAFIPLERRISDRLLRLAKGQQRPQCSKCQFYIDANEFDDFYDHIDNCDGDLTRCRYCSCPYSVDELDNHRAPCRDDRSSQNDKLIQFIMKRTKYPVTKEQIRIFIQQERNDAGDVDPLTVVYTLAAFGPVFPFDVPTKVCDVCMEACLYEDIYVFDCPDSHKLCYQCFYQSCAMKMSNGELLTCALCSTPLRDCELDQLRVSAEERKKFQNYQTKKTLDAYSNHTRGIIKCPNQSCSWFVEAEDPTQRFKVQCRLCQTEFCSLCNQQYHYRTRCQQMPQITQQWYLWCETERPRYLKMRAQEDEAYAVQLNEYNRRMNENEDRNRELRRRYDELMRDEQYKVQNCRLCPSCKRVVQRIEGCDTMICGQDAHGGNIQSGCGTKFNWTTAQPYTATTEFQRQQSTIDLPEPEQPVVEHIGVQCDQCQHIVMGIRFDCVHCPTLTYCEKCEQQSTLNHSKDNQRMKQRTHVFRLIMTPEEVSSQ